MGRKRRSGCQEKCFAKPWEDKFGVRNTNDSKGTSQLSTYLSSYLYKDEVAQHMSFQSRQFCFLFCTKSTR